jgi:hypothetical protein
MQTQVSLYEDELDTRESILEGAMDLNARELATLQLTWDTSPFLNRKTMQNITQRMDLHHYLSNRGRMT